MTALTAEAAKVRQELRSAEEARDAYKRELAGEDPVMLPDMNGIGDRAAARPSTTRASTRSANSSTNCCAVIPTSIPTLLPPAG